MPCHFHNNIYLWSVLLLSFVELYTFISSFPSAKEASQIYPFPAPNVLTTELTQCPVCEPQTHQPNHHSTPVCCSLSLIQVPSPVAIQIRPHRQFHTSQLSEPQSSIHAIALPVSIQIRSAHPTIHESQERCFIVVSEIPCGLGVGGK